MHSGRHLRHPFSPPASVLPGELVQLLHAESCCSYFPRAGGVDFSPSVDPKAFDFYISDPYQLLWSCLLSGAVWAPDLAAPWAVCES